MVRSRRSVSKEDASSVLADSGISLSSPQANRENVAALDEDEEKAILDALCTTDDEQGPETVKESDLDVNSKNTEKDGKDKFKINATTSLEPPVKKNRKCYVCEICQKKFRGKSDLSRHKFIHTSEKPYTCELCNKSYRQEVNLRNHVTSAHKKQKEFTCKECSKSFALKERLRLHMRVHTGEKPYACQQCDKRFARGGQLNQHTVTHHQDSPKQFKCEVCSAGFSTSSNLKAHMQGHSESPDFFCEICNQHFANGVLLKAHVHKMHRKLKQLDCGICKEPIEEHELMAHMKIHTNAKTYVCEICKSMFSQKSQYNVHLRMHTGERPFQCRICFQAFAHSSVLKLHVRKHTGEKPFHCLLCKVDEVAFSQLAHLKTHMRKIHNQCKPYMCEGCHEYFKVKIQLDAHQQGCKKYTVSPEEQETQENETNTLSHIRLLMAILLKRISSDEKLQQLGFEKRLIDNVLIAALKLASRNVCDDVKLPPLQRMLLNVEEFLKWIVPCGIMKKFRAENHSIENVLEQIVCLYVKQK